MTTALAPTTHAQIQPIIELVTNAVTSRHTKTAYGRALREFIEWYQEAGAPGLSKATIQAHVTDLRAKGKTASSINQRLTAIRKFAQEVADNGLIDSPTAMAIGCVEGVHVEGKRLGNWLSHQQAPALLQAPDVTTRQGLARSCPLVRPVRLWAASGRSC